MTHRNVVEGEAFAFPVPGRWPGGKSGRPDDAGGERRPRWHRVRFVQAWRGLPVNPEDSPTRPRR